VHLCVEQQPKQLMGLYQRLCHVLRVETGREPEFSLPTDLRGDAVYELSPDCRARWPLLGGAGGQHSTAMLVLTEKPARFANGDEVIPFGRPCSCGRGSAHFRLTRAKIVQAMAKKSLHLYCIMCDGSFELSPQEAERLKAAL